VAQEVLQNYRQHPSLAGWYFTQELWLNWVKYYGSSYYGVTLLLGSGVKTRRQG
jgi:hypothetical protein